MDASIDKSIRKWISEIIIQHESVLRIAIRQRAKFEGWLKFELAALAEECGAEAVEVEARSDTTTSLMRSDISFTFNDVRYDIELKTPNTSWKMPGVCGKTRPITKNVAGIVRDGRKLKTHSSQGVIAFVLFPIPPEDNRWTEYLNEISRQLATPINENDNCERLSLALDNGSQAELVICTFHVH